jgi:uroporphyrin-III C-methyltransferase/precorrin-2 dehydrogenase/sirohydrochlorin ferrochelatase
LITVRGRRLLAEADVIITDRLGPRSLVAELAGVRSGDVTVIDVGKLPGNHPVPQSQINQMLVDHARTGALVVRLKGGDPFVLGRGGEEALYCAAHGVSVEVVPGVTSAVAVPAAAGIPVTHRGITTSFVVASAHAGGQAAAVAAHAAAPDATLVLLMGVSALAQTASDLIAAGRPPQTPVAVIADGWLPTQEVVTGSLDGIADSVAHRDLAGRPAVIVVGDVVGVREELRGLGAVA